MFRRSHPASKLSNTELKKLEHLFQMVDSCTIDMQSQPGLETSRKLADTINGYPNATMVYEVMRRIRKCFKSGNPQVVLRALDLTDTLMQSCGAHARREVGSDKFLKLVGKLCKIAKTRMDPSWQTVSERAQDLIQDWAEASEQMVGPGSRFAQAYHNLRREGVQFREGLPRSGGMGRVGGRGGIHRLDRAGFGMRQRGIGSSRGILQPRAVGYDEDAQLAAAIADSLDADGPAAGRSGVDLAASAEDGDLLSMVPPTIEALMDIMEGSRDLDELLENEVAPDVVDQTKGLVEQVIKQVEYMESGGNPDERDMDRYLKAHDDLQTVLRIYESVMDGKTSLPLRRPGLDAGDANREEEGGLSGVDLGGSDVLGLESTEDNGNDLLNDEDRKSKAGSVRGSRRRSRGGRPRTRSGTDNTRHASPAKGNLLDLEENEPLEMGLDAGGGGILVPYTGGVFQANTTGTGADSASSAAFGSESGSNFQSETGAVYGSSNGGSTFSGQAPTYGISGDNVTGFGQGDPFAAFGNAPGAPAPLPSAGSHRGFGESPSSFASSITSYTASKGTPNQTAASDFGTWMSTVGAGGGGGSVGNGGDPFAPSPTQHSIANGARGAGDERGNKRDTRFAADESTSFSASNDSSVGPPGATNGGDGGSTGGAWAHGGHNPFDQAISSSGSSGAGAFPSSDWSTPAAAKAPKNESSDPFTLEPSPAGARSGGFQTRQTPTTSVVQQRQQQGFPAFSQNEVPRNPQPNPPQQQGNWWRAQQQQQPPQQQHNPDPFMGAILPINTGPAGGGTGTTFGTNNDPFAPALGSGPRSAPSSRPSSYDTSGRTPSDAGGAEHFSRNSADSNGLFGQHLDGVSDRPRGSGGDTLGGAGAFSQALAVYGRNAGGNAGVDAPGATAPQRKFNPFDDPLPMGYDASRQQGVQGQLPWIQSQLEQPQQQQQQNFRQDPFQQAPQFQQVGGQGRFSQQSYGQQPQQQQQQQRPQQHQQQRPQQQRPPVQQQTNFFV